jgi:hypothetical protein
MYGSLQNLHEPVVDHVAESRIIPRGWFLTTHTLAGVSKLKNYCVILCHQDLLRYWPLSPKVDLLRKKKKRYKCWLPSAHNLFLSS